MGGIPSNAAFWGHDWYSVLTGNVGEIALNVWGEFWRECGMCYVNFYYFPGEALQSGAQGGSTGDLLAVVILAAGLFSGFIFLTLTLLMAIITLQLFLLYLLVWTSFLFFTSVNQQVLHPAGHLKSNWNTSPYICKSKCLFSCWTREMQCLTMQE